MHGDGMLYRAGDDGQQDVRGAGAVVKNRLVGTAQLPLVRYGAAGVGVAVETREVAAGDFQADAVALLEFIAGHAGVNDDGVDVPGLREHRFFERLAVAEPQDSVGQVAGRAVRKDIDQLGSEIGVGLGGGYIKEDADRSGDFERLF